jgi:hypothetical protein
MATGPGRPPGRDLTELEFRHVDLLGEVRDRAHQYAARYDELFEDFVLEMRESGCSNRSIGRTLHVSPQIVQGWCAKARHRRRAG